MGLGGHLALKLQAKTHPDQISQGRKRRAADTIMVLGIKELKMKSIYFVKHIYLDFLRV